MKKPAERRVFSLLDLRFLVRHVFAYFRIEFLYFHLLRMEALVLGRRVEMTGAGARYELDLLTHGSGLLLNSHALGAKVRDHLFDTALLDGAQAARRHAQTHEAAPPLIAATRYVQCRSKPAAELV